MPARLIFGVCFALLVSLLVAAFFSGHALWYLSHLHGDPPWNASWLFWSAGTAAQKSQLIRAMLVIYAVLVFLTLAGIISYFIRQRRMVYGTTRLARRMEVNKAGLFSKTGLFFGYFQGRPLFDNSQLHVLLIAESGTGKGVSLIIPNLFLWSGSVICTDMKRENYRKTSGYRADRGQAVFCFDPFSRETHRINPLIYFQAENPIDHFQRMAYVIYPDPDKGEKIWASNARSLFIGLSLLIYLESGRNAVTFANIIATFSTMHWENLTQRMQSLEGPSFLIERCFQLLQAHAATPDKTRGGFEAEFRAALDIFMNPSVAWATGANEVPLEELRTRPITLYLNSTPANIARVYFLMRMILETVNMLHTQEEFGENPAHRYPLLLLNDEQHNFYGRMPLMLKAASFYRSYGMRIFSVYQSVAQIELDYGKDGARAYMDNHNIRIYYCPQDKEKARQFAREIGETTIFTRSRSSGPGGRGSSNLSPQKREAYLPEQLIRMLGEQNGLLFIAGANAVKFRKAVWYKEKVFSNRERPPIELPHATEHELEAFLGNTDSLETAVHMEAHKDPIKTLAEKVKQGAAATELNALIDDLLLQEAP